MGSLHRRKGSKWWRIQWVDARGQIKTKTLKGITSEKIAKAILGKIEHNTALERTGFVDPSEAKVQREGRRAIKEQIDGWQKHIEAADRSDSYAEVMSNLVRRVLKLARVCCLLDIVPGDIKHAIGKMPRERGEGDVSARQKNKALRACKMFCEQMRRDGKLRTNILADVTGWDERTDKRHQHVAFEPELAERVIAAADASKETVERLTGPQRAMLYRVCAGTGFRKGTCRRLRVRDLKLTSPTPFIKVLATNVKNKVEADQPISHALARQLAKYVKRLGENQRLFPFTANDNTAEMMRHDFASIGVDYDMGDGYFRDFHSWRNTFGTEAGKATGNIKEVQMLMGHSTPVLTARYMRPTLHDVRRVVEALPGATESKGGKERTA